MRKLVFLRGCGAAAIGLLALATACDSPTEAGERPMRILYRSEAVEGTGWYLASVDGKQRVRVPSLGPDVYHVAWAPDGQRLALTAGGDPGLYLAQADGSGRTQLTSSPGFSHFAAWSPDGTRIAYWNSDTPFGLVVMNLDGTGAHKPAGARDAGLAPISWSPDGTQIVFVRHDARPDPSGSGSTATISLFVLDVASGTSRRLTMGERGDVDPAWSPDGSRIVFARCFSSRQKNLFAVRPDGTGLQRLTEGEWIDAGPTWSPDGAEIAFERALSLNSDIWVIRADGTRPRNLTDSPVADYFPAWNPAPPRSP